MSILSKKSVLSRHKIFLGPTTHAFSPGHRRPSHEMLQKQFAIAIVRNGDL
jgi:hypothetical protein